MLPPRGTSHRTPKPRLLAPQDAPQDSPTERCCFPGKEESVSTNISPEIPDSLSTHQLAPSPPVQHLCRRLRGGYALLSPFYR